MKLRDAVLVAMPVAPFEPSLRINGHRFALDLPPVVARQLRDVLVRHCDARLERHPWIGTYDFRIILPPPRPARWVYDPGPPGAETATYRDAGFRIHGPADNSPHDWLLEPTESVDRETIAAYARELLSLQLNDLEGWAQC